MKKLFLTQLLGVCSIAAVMGGDILTLTNNMAFEGHIAKIKNCEIVFKVRGARYVVPAADIQSIQFEDVSNPIYLEYLDAGENCLKGSTDAQQLHGKKAGHFFLGFLFGPFAMIGTALSTPTPYRSTNTMALSQNKDLFTDPEYLSCYKKKAKGSLIGMEAVGFAAWLVLYFAVNAGE